MTPDQDSFDLLESLLEEERAVLLNGELGKIEDLLPRKEALIAQILEHSWPDSDTVATLQSKLERNQMLLDGAMDGIRAVALRLAALRQVREGLDTYDAQGRKRTAKDASGSKVEKRA